MLDQFDMTPEALHDLRDDDVCLRGFGFDASPQYSESRVGQKTRLLEIVN